MCSAKILSKTHQQEMISYGGQHCTMINALVCQTCEVLVSGWLERYCTTILCIPLLSDPCHKLKLPMYLLTVLMPRCDILCVFE